MFGASPKLSDSQTLKPGVRILVLLISALMMIGQNKKDFQHFTQRQTD